MATSVQALVARLVAFRRTSFAALQFLPHAALALLFLAIALHWMGLVDSSETLGSVAFFALVFAVIFRREPT